MEDLAVDYQMTGKVDYLMVICFIKTRKLSSGWHKIIIWKAQGVPQ